MSRKGASRTESSPPKATLPEPPQANAAHTDWAEWVVKVLQKFETGWIEALPGDEQDSVVFGTDYRSDLIDAPCSLPKDFRDGVLRLLPQAANAVIRLESVLSWKSADDANRLAALIRTIVAEIEGTNETAEQVYNEIPLDELRRLRIELQNAKARTHRQVVAGGSNGKAKLRTKPKTPRRRVKRTMPTPNELRVLELGSQGYTDRQIAHEMGISPGRVSQLRKAAGKRSAPPSRSISQSDTVSLKDHDGTAPKSKKRTRPPKDD